MTQPEVNREYLRAFSHDIRSPLGRIMGYADLMLRDDEGKFASERTEILEQIRKDAQLMLDMLNELNRRLSADEQNS